MKNERINQIVEHAVINPQSPLTFADELNVKFMRLFAESIVKEAIEVVNKRYMGDNNREDMEVRRCVEDLRKHFGIE